MKNYTVSKNFVLITDKASKKEKVNVKGWGGKMNKDNGWDASASWNGYMYQGKVALLVALKKINDIEDISGYWLESEGIEDFSIGLGEEYKTIHQVKNRKDKNLKDYREALSNIVKKIRDYPEIEKGYLHVKNQISINNWDKDIYNELLDYYPQKIQQLEEIVACNKSFNEAYDEILGKWNQENKKFDKRTNDIYKMIIKIMEVENHFENKADITKEVFKIACEKILIDEKENYDFAGKDNVINKIKLFNYFENEESKEDASKKIKGKFNASSSEIIDMSLMEIEKYWDEISEYRTQKKEIYYMKLLALINENITERAEDGSKKIKILFDEFKRILDEKSVEICKSTIEEALLRLKYLYMKEKEEFCTDNICLVKSCENCDNCNLEVISDVILQYSLPELETIFRIMALHKIENLTEKGSELFSKPELENSFFSGITEINKEFFISEYKVLCQIHDKYMLATTIDAERQGRKNKTIEGLIRNNIQDVCNKIINNDEYDTTLMEVDKLVTRNFDTEDIFVDACKINLITEDNEPEDNLKYMNITRTKKVGLISVKKAKQVYGERK